MLLKVFELELEYKFLAPVIREKHLHNGWHERVESSVVYTKKMKLSCDTVA